MARRRIVFFGAGPVALASLRHLHTIYDIELVVTKPNPRSSRAPKPVFDYVSKHNLPYIQSAKKTDLETLLKEKDLTSEIGIIVDYGVIVSQSVIDMFTLGIVNSHFSLLPLWRGADPITFSLLSGVKETGVSLMVINEQLDEGQLLAQEPYEITERETITSLTDNLVRLSNEMFSQYLDNYIDGSLKPYDQNVKISPSYSRKLIKADGVIDWSKSADQIDLEIRAYLGWPGSKTTLQNTEVTIAKANVVSSSLPDSEPGDITIHKKPGSIEITTGKRSLSIEQLKPAGKKEMDAKAFINGYLES